MTDEKLDALIRGALQSDTAGTPPDLGPAIRRHRERRRMLRTFAGAAAACLVLGVGTASYFRLFGGASKAAPEAAFPESPMITNSIMAETTAEPAAAPMENAMPLPEACEPACAPEPVPMPQAVSAGTVDEEKTLPASSEPEQRYGNESKNGADGRATPSSETVKALFAALPELEAWDRPEYELISESARWQVWCVRAGEESRELAYDLTVGKAYDLNSLMPWISRVLKDEKMYIGEDEILYILQNGEWAASGSLADGAPVKYTP